MTGLVQERQGVPPLLVPLTLTESLPLVKEKMPDKTTAHNNTCQLLS